MTQPGETARVVNKTLIVLLTLFGVCCALPCALFLIFGGLGSMLPDP